MRLNVNKGLQLLLSLDRSRSEVLVAYVDTVANAIFRHPLTGDDYSIRVANQLRILYPVYSHCATFDIF